LWSPNRRFSPSTRCPGSSSVGRSGFASHRVDAASRRLRDAYSERLGASGDLARTFSNSCCRATVILTPSRH